MFFLSGLPRSGSTVLAALLNQRPDISVTPTSGLIDIFGAVVSAWDKNPSVVGQGQTKEHLYSILRKLAPKSDSGKITVDKSRGWVDPAIQGTMEKVLGGPPKIVATVRDVKACAASFVKLFNPSDIGEFLNSGSIQHLKDCYATLRDGYAAYPENILFVDYAELTSDPESVILKIEEFWGLRHFQHMFTGIDGSSVAEDDEAAWGIAGLHTIRPDLTVNASNPEDILGEHCYKFDAPRFWIGETSAKKDALDLQTQLAIQGKVEEAEELCDIIYKLRPTDNRAAYNRGWYAFRKGNLEEGFSLLDRGRKEGLFGNICPSSMPTYGGQALNGEVVLLVLESGLGDQIHSARWAREISARGGVCVVSCSPELAPLMLQVEGVSAVVESRAAGGVYHHFHVMGMSGYLSFRIVNNTPYILSKPHTPNGRVGIRWAGNPQFEHDMHRKFDPTPLFDLPGTLVSLQRDDGSELTPGNLEALCLDTWLHTKQVIGGLDRVITACTSIAHLSAAMGKETWVIVPLLPYYLWADGKDTSIWYKNVKLFRQTEYGSWDCPIKKIVEKSHSLALGHRGDDVL